MSAHWGRLPARLRLALWYSLLLGATVLALGGVSLWLIQRVLYSTADEVLRTKAAAVQTEVDVDKGRLVFDAPTLADTNMPAVGTGLDLIRIWRPDGKSIYGWASLTGIAEPDTATVRSVIADRRAYETAAATDGSPVRLYMEPIHDDKSRIIGVIQVGRSLAEI